jgi:hypothetical protein
MNAFEICLDYKKKMMKLNYFCGSSGKNMVGVQGFGGIRRLGSPKKKI